MQKNPAQRKTQIQYKADVNAHKHGRLKASNPYLEVVFDE
jgi:hypothetical protein